MIIKMPPDEALEAGRWLIRGKTFHEDSTGWPAVIAVLIDEVERLRKEKR